MRRLIVFMCISIIIMTQVSLAAPKTRRRTPARKAVSTKTINSVPVTDSTEEAANVETTDATDRVATSESNSDVSTVGVAAATGSTAADEFKKAGDRFLRKGQMKKSVEAYQQCLELGGSDTANARIAMVVGKYCFNEKKYEEALHYFDMVTGKPSGTLPFKLMVGTSLQMIGKNDSAIAILEPFASNQKIPVASRKDMYKVIGDAYLANKKENTAVVWYNKYMRSGGRKTADIAYLIAVAQAATVPSKAALLFEGNIKRYPSDYRNYLQLGILQSKKKATRERSVGLFKKVISLVDTIPDAWFEMGKVNQALGKTEEAIAAYSAGLKIDDRDLDVKMNIGTLLLEKGSAEEAAKYLELAYKQAPDSIGPISLLSTAYIRSGNPNKAIDLFEKIKAASPKDVVVRKQLVDAYQSIGQDQKAFEEIQGVLELERDRESLFSYGKMLVKMGKYDEAIAALEEILGAMPDDLETLMMLGSIYRKQKKFDDAVGVYKEVCSMDPKYGPALYERAEVHLEQGKVKWAEMFYKRALSADPSMALAEVGLAKLAELYNRKDQVDLHLSKAEGLAADDPVVKKAINDVRFPSKSTAKRVITEELTPDDETIEETGTTE